MILAAMNYSYQEPLFIRYFSTTTYNSSFRTIFNKCIIAPKSV